ncbi:MAG: isoprenylcysteine carboxylmethyltransferase family protein [Bdellovibrionaceae bacterium]|nr:isoprenylcysteine carboxylmethyltransferase family protein [Bdellovibrionales bacterium]MCB9255311.1 isoprenylcysteine carboxylmethyltransferase family protein [Pseudobdellovibrionaceae bacterium]
MQTPAFQLGRIWFKYRGYSPVPVLLFVLLMPVVFAPSPLVSLALIVLILASEAIRIWAVGYAGSVTRTRGDAVNSLVCAGPFRYVRNPLYIANVTMYVSWSVLFGVGPYAALAALFFAVQYSLIVRYEEGILTETFGEAYAAYQQKVPRWLPRLTPAVPGSEHVFDLPAALRSERSTFLAMLLTAAAYWLKNKALS